MEFDKLQNTDPNLTVIGGGKSDGKSGGGGKLAAGNFTTSPEVMGAQSLLPQAQQMLSGLFQSYGLQYPEINMGDPKLKDKVVAVGKVAEVAKTNMVALEQMLQHTATLMAGQIKLAEFYSASTQIVVEGKKRIDAATAQSFLALAGYQQATNALKEKVGRKLQILEKRTELAGQLGEGKLQTALNLIDAQKEAGDKRQKATQDLHTKRQQLLAATGISREKDKEQIRYGHLVGAGKALAKK